MPDEIQTEAAAGMKVRRDFLHKHRIPEEESVVLVATDPTQLAIVCGAASPELSAVLCDRKYFAPKDISVPYMSLPTILDEKEKEMKQVIWPSPQGASFLLAVSYTALDETREMTKKLLAHYAQVNMKIVIFTPNESRLFEGADALQGRLPFAMDSIEKVPRPMGVVGGGQPHTWIIESRHTTRTNPFACAPRKALVNVLPPGQDPLQTVLSLQPTGNRMAISINNKESAQLIKDIQQPEGKIAIATPH